MQYQYKYYRFNNADNTAIILYNKQLCRQKLTWYQFPEQKHHKPAIHNILTLKQVINQLPTMILTLVLYDQGASDGQALVLKKS